MTNETGRSSCPARLLLWVVLGVVLGATHPSLAQQPALSAAALVEWHASSVAIAHRDPLMLAPGMLPAAIDAAVRLAPDLFRVEEIGRSVEGRPIRHVWFGRGPFPVLLWSQMHGDEASATTALIDILQYVATHRSDPVVGRLLDRLTIHLVPMLNPDGADRFQRRNAQGIDINRDALLLQTPEGRTLKALRDRLAPRLAFNLHNQNWKTSVGKTGRPATFSLLAVAFDEARTESPGRVLAKRTCAILRDAFEDLVPGQVARYDDEFEVRAFGDNVTKWGTPVVLIETGPYQGATADLDLIRFNFVGILQALDALASGRVEHADPARYESLPMNDSNLQSVLVRNVSIVTGTGIGPFTGDVGLASTRIVRRVDGAGAVREAVQVFRIDDLGDLRTYGALEAIDGTGLVLAPAMGGWTAGRQVSMAGWETFKSDRPLAVGVSQDLALLRAVGPGVFTVVRILPAERRLER